MSVEINDLENTEIDTTYIDDIKSSRIEDFYIDNIVNIPLIKGEKGDKGDKGDKPVVGVDYYTEAEKTEFKNAVIQDSKTDIDEYTSSKKNEYNDNAIEKIQKYNSNAISKTETFNTNAQNKIDEYNTNAESLINRIAGVESKNTEQDTNIANKVDKEAGKGLSSNDYTDAEKEKLASLSNYNDTKIKADITDIELTNTEQDKKIEELEKENIKLKNQIPNGTVSGNAIHIEDSSDLELKWRLNGGHKQETREGYNFLKVEKETTTTNGITFTINKDGGVTCKGTATANATLYFASANNSIYPKEIDIGKYKIVGGTTNVMLGCQIGSTYYNTNSNRIIELTEQSSISNAYLQIASGTTVNNETIYPLLYKYDNVEKKYEQYGISPSPEYPSEIETVNGSVKIDVVNKNWLKLTQRVANNGVTATIDEDVITLNGTATSGYSNITAWSDCNIKAGQYMYSVDKAQNFKINIACEYEDGTRLDISLAEGKTSVKVNFTKNVSRIYVYIQNVLNKTFKNLSFRIQLEKGLTVTSIIKHEEQSVTMPIQQEMLEGDYINDVEHHEWGKVILTGNDFNYLVQQNGKGLNYFIFRYPLVKIKGRIISNMLKNNVNIWDATQYIDCVTVSNKQNIINIMLSDTTITTVAQFKAKLQELYNAGTPVILYYKLATPLDLELTTEQKVIREQKLHTYKNVTNISLSNDLAIVDVSYKKDVETITKNCVQKEDGKELSSNNYTNAEKEKLTNIEENAEVNIIESIKKNGVALKVKDKTIDIVVPTKISELSNDSSFQTKDEVSTSIKSAINLTWESDL